MKMQKAFLALAVMFAAGIVTAYNFEEAQSRVSSANARLAQVRRKASSLDAEIQRLQDKLSSLAGSEQGAGQFAAAQAALRAKIQERNNCISQTEDAIKNLSTETSSVGQRYVVSGGEGKYDVAEASYQKLEPIQHSYQAKTTQTSGGHYAPRARRW